MIDPQLPPLLYRAFPERPASELKQSSLVSGFSPPDFDWRANRPNTASGAQLYGHGQPAGMASATPPRRDLAVAAEL